jgi:hypothetical protein
MYDPERMRHAGFDYEGVGRPDAKVIDFRANGVLAKA